MPGPRVPFAPQYVGLIDEVCWFFPELKFVTRHGCEPWADLAVKLLLKWPNLYYSTSAFAPKFYPKDVIHFANTRGADKVMYAGYFPMGLSLERIFGEMPDVPFRDHVWPKFLRENAIRVFKLPTQWNGRAGPTEWPSAGAFESGGRKAGGSVDTVVGFPKSREEHVQVLRLHPQADARRREQGRRRARVPRGLHVQGRPEVGRRRDGRPGRDPARRARSSRHPPGDRHPLRRTGRAGAA